MKDKNCKEVIINGHKLLCPICGGNTFWENKDMVNSKWAILFGFFNKKMENFICQQCGYINWFWND